MISLVKGKALRYQNIFKIHTCLEPSPRSVWLCGYMIGSGVCICKKPHKIIFLKNFYYFIF